MKVIDSAQEMRSNRSGLTQPVALVPTMGGLHRGHEKLLEEARKRSKTLVASLFLNPLQFDQVSDLDSYPNDRLRDLEIFRYHDVDIVFAPEIGEMYPQNSQTLVDPGPLGKVLEGCRRPGHFVGVCTIVTKLLTLIRPDVAFLGSKDAQQVVIVRRLVKDLFLDTKIVEIPTVRDQNGVALSSRLILLDEVGRRAAAAIYPALIRGNELFQDGVLDAVELRKAVEAELEKESLLKIEYVAATHPEMLTELNDVYDGALLSLAVAVGGVRLIDSIILTQRRTQI